MKIEDIYTQGSTNVIYNAIKLVDGTAVSCGDDCLLYEIDLECSYTIKEGEKK